VTSRSRHRDLGLRLQRRLDLPSSMRWPQFCLLVDAAQEQQAPSVSRRTRSPVR
jgi:hypothetical protein